MKTATLITGASSGIGYELSRLFAQNGHNLVLVARSQPKLQQLADELTKKYSISAKVMVKDLAISTTPDEIFTELERESIQVDILVNNAGIQVYGPFVEADLAKNLQLIQINLTALTHLTGLFLPGMVKRGRGKILNMASTGAFVPGVYNAVYCATKSFVLNFSQAIAEELEGTGVTVTALCPGATRTDFITKAGMEDVQLFQSGVMEAAVVAQAGYRAMIKNKRVVVPGFGNQAMIFAVKFVPSKLLTRMGRKIMGRVGETPR